MSPGRSHPGGSADAAALTAVGIADSELVVGIGVACCPAPHTGD
ncbi:hypothetical protein [Bradyrhizobium sp.]